jgi:uncharacterized membrane protein YqjE
MPQTKQHRQGLLASIGELASTLLVIGRTRLELLSTDLAEDREHLLLILKLTLISMFCLGVGIIMITVWILMMFWDSHGLIVLGSLAVLFLLIGTLSWRYSLSAAKRKPRMFESSLSELLKDWESLNE